MNLNDFIITLLLGGAIGFISGVFIRETIDWFRTIRQKKHNLKVFKAYKAPKL